MAAARGQRQQQHWQQQLLRWRQREERREEGPGEALHWEEWRVVQWLKAGRRRGERGRGQQFGVQLVVSAEQGH